MEAGGAERRQTTLFHLVDLAGSENFSSVNAAASSINGGLLALGKVLTLTLALTLALALAVALTRTRTRTLALAP